MRKFFIASATICLFATPSHAWRLFGAGTTCSSEEVKSLLAKSIKKKDNLNPDVKSVRSIRTISDKEPLHGGTCKAVLDLVEHLNASTIGNSFGSKISGSNELFMAAPIISRKYGLDIKQLDSPDLNLDVTAEVEVKYTFQLSDDSKEVWVEYEKADVLSVDVFISPENLEKVKAGAAAREAAAQRADEAKRQGMAECEAHVPKGYGLQTWDAYDNAIRIGWCRDWRPEVGLAELPKGNGGIVFAHGDPAAEWPRPYAEPGSSSVPRKGGGSRAQKPAEEQPQEAQTRHEGPGRPATNAKKRPMEELVKLEFSGNVDPSDKQGMEQLMTAWIFNLKKAQEDLGKEIVYGKECIKNDCYDTQRIPHLIRYSDHNFDFVSFKYLQFNQSKKTKDNNFVCLVNDRLNDKVCMRLFEYKLRRYEAENGKWKEIPLAYE